MSDSTIPIVLTETNGKVRFEGEATGEFGGSSPFTFVGPVVVAWDDPEILDGVFICDLATNAVVVAVQMVPTEDWNAGAGLSYILASFVIGIGGSNGSTIGGADLLNLDAVDSDIHLAAPLTLTGSGGLQMGGYASVADAGLYVSVSTDGNDGGGAVPTAGSANVFVLIGAPS